MKVLFVGGDANGKTLEVNQLTPWHKLPVRTTAAAAAGGCYAVQSYKLEFFEDGAGIRHPLYMHGAVADPVKLLLESFADLGRRVEELLS